MLRTLVAERFGAAAVPATVTMIDQVPVSATGKPDKAALLTGPFAPVAALPPRRARGVETLLSPSAE